MNTVTAPTGAVDLLVSAFVKATQKADMNQRARTYNIRYSGDFGRSLYGQYESYEDALIARGRAVRCALENGNPRLAASFELC